VLLPRSLSQCLRLKRDICGSFEDEAYMDNELKHTTHLQSQHFVVYFVDMGGLNVHTAD
jgi:hypothetical protein